MVRVRPTSTCTDSTTTPSSPSSREPLVWGMLAPLLLDASRTPSSQGREPSIGHRHDPNRSHQTPIKSEEPVYVGTAVEWVGICPGCRTRSLRSKGWVTTRPRDVNIGADRPLIVWRKRKCLCTNILCESKSFTESTPSLPPRARVTTRAKAEMALAVLDDDRSVQAVGAAYGCSWNTCHDAVIATADPVLAGEPPPVRVLGIDETRRGKA